MRKGNNLRWITPPNIIKALGQFDLDPCADVQQPWPMATHQYTVIDDGLKQKWFGRVYVNPPYAEFAQYWCEKMGEYRNGIVLIPSRTGSPWFHRQVFEKADSILFLEDRIWFYDIYGNEAKGNAGHDSVLLAYGDKNIETLMSCGLKGAHRFNVVQPLIIVGVSPSWRSVVTIALGRLDGTAHVQAIYDVVKFLAPDKVKSNPHFKEKIREKLQKYFVRLQRGTYTTQNK